MLCGCVVATFLHIYTSTQTQRQAFQKWKWKRGRLVHTQTTVWRVISCVFKYKIESPAKQRETLLCISCILCSATKYKCYNTGGQSEGRLTNYGTTITPRSCGFKRNTQNVSYSQKNTPPSHIPVTSDGSRYKKCCLLTIIAILKKEMFIVKINLSKLLDRKKKGWGSADFYAYSMFRIMLGSGKEPRFVLKSMLHLDFHFWYSPPSLKCLTVHCFRVRL